MDYSRNSVKNTLDDIRFGDTRAANRFSRTIRAAALILLLLAFLAGVAATIGAVAGIIENSPDIHEISFSPKGFASMTYDAGGNLSATLVKAGANREEVKYEEIPEDLINAFVAIEDQRFWEHNGIDIRSITRAVRGVLTGNSSDGGGSTITQQLIKNNVFAGGMEKGFALYERKFQEWYLALALENQPEKDKQEIKKEIITDYLNTINLGSNTLGVRVASKKYFGKDVTELNLSECSALAAITKNPSRLNPLTHPDENQERRLQVLKKMEAQGYISEQQRKEASKEDVYEEIRKVNEASGGASSYVYSYFTDALIGECIRAFRDELGMTEAEAKDLLYSGGLSIYTTQDPAIQKIVDEEINNPDNYDTAKYSIKWNLSLTHPDGTASSYTEKDILAAIREKEPSFNGLFKSKESAEESVESFRSRVLSESDTVKNESLDMILEPQASFVVIDQHTREVKAICGGRGEKEYSLTTNRATGSLRQPGSTFKVLTAFAPAIEKNGATLGTVYYDSMYTVGNKQFRNWWSSGQYFGWSSIREGIEFSMNIVAVRCLIDTVTPDAGAKFAENLGITSLVDEDISGALALGGLTRGVSNLELTNAFASIASGGDYGKYKLFTRICDHSGNVLIDRSSTETRRVMKESTAFLLTDAMRMSTVGHTKWSSGFTVNNTSSRSHLSNMICAGKSGTTTSNKDIWFVGFTPYYTAGVWGGCDENQVLSDSGTGEYNGGTSFHKDIWNKIMTRIHQDLPDPGSFEKPDTVVSMAICRKSGLPAGPGCELDIRNGSSAVYTEYFDKDNVPHGICDHHLEDGSIVIPYPIEETGETDDTRVNQAILEAASAEAENTEVSASPSDQYSVIYSPGTTGLKDPSQSGPAFESVSPAAESYD